MNEVQSIIKTARTEFADAKVANGHLRELFGTTLDFIGDHAVDAADSKEAKELSQILHRIISEVGLSMTVQVVKNGSAEDARNLLALLNGPILDFGKTMGIWCMLVGWRAHELYMLHQFDPQEDTTDGI